MLWVNIKIDVKFTLLLLKKLLHTHLNHLAEKCQVHVAIMNLSSKDLLYYLTDQSILLPSHLYNYEHYLQNERETNLV